MVSYQSPTIWKSVITLLYVCTIVVTAARLIHRYRGRRMWKDDYLAVVPMALALIPAVVQWYLYMRTDSHKKILLQTALYWLMVISWSTIIWLTRISLALSLARITHPGGTPRRFAFSLTYVFIIFYVTSLAWLFTTGCKHSGRLRSGIRTLAYCNGNKLAYSITSFVADFISEITLIASSLVLYTRASLPHPQRIRILTITFSTLLMLLSTITYSVVYYAPIVSGTNGFLIIDMVAQIEAIASIVAINILPFVIVVRKVWYNESDADVASTPTSATSLKKLSFSSTHKGTSPISIITLTDFKKSGTDKYGFPRDDESDISGYAIKSQPMV